MPHTGKGAPARLLLRIGRQELDRLDELASAATFTAPLDLILGWCRSDTVIVFTLARIGGPDAGDPPGLITGHLRLAAAGEAPAFSPAEQQEDDARAAGCPVFVSVKAGRGKDAPRRIAARVWLDGKWHELAAVALEGERDAELFVGGAAPGLADPPPDRVARFTSAFGIEAYQRLRRSTVAVIGAGGTGSIAIPTLARAGVGRLIIVDSDHVSPSNLERMHASFPEHVAARTLKAELARDHVARIDPEIEVEAWVGRLPQRAIVEAVAAADVVLGCTDQQSSRLALADVARRYLVPAIDCGGLIEGANGRVTGQIVQLVRFRPGDPCPHCRRMIDPLRVRQELMSEAERTALRATAGEAPPPEAEDIPQIDTVGYITTVSGTLAAGYAIGWLTGRFDPPFERMQMNLIAECLDVTNRRQAHDPACQCQALRGMADQGAGAVPFTPPDHWPAARRLEG